MRVPSLALVLPLLAAAGLAAGCSANRTSTAGVCPDSAIIYGLDRLAATDRQGREVIASLENIDGVCRLSGRTLSLEMSFDVVAVAPAGTEIPYFVAITDPVGAILDKVAFSIVMPPTADGQPVRLRETLTQEIRDVEPGTSARHMVLIGLDLPTETALRQRREL